MLHSAKTIHRLLIVAGLSGLWLGLTVFGPGTGQAAGAPLGRVVQTGPNSSASCSVPGALEGVDVTHSDGPIDWAQVAQTKAFAYAKASEGTIYTDTLFLTNYAGIRAAGMKAGAYMYFRAAQDPTQQANILVRQLLNAHFAAGDLVPMIDVETTDGKTGPEITAALQTTVDVIKHSLLVTPGIYSYGNFVNMQVGWTAFASSPLWLAFFSANCPTPPSPWNNWAVWQYADNGSVPGINLAVDLDRSNGASLPLYAGSRQSFLPLTVVTR